MKVIFSDIDGTFTMQTGIPTVNIEAVKALEEKGDRFVFVSGRNPKLIDMLLEECGFDCDYIFGNGAGFRLMGQEPKYNHYIEANQYNILEELMDKFDVFYHIHTNVGVIMKPLEVYEKHISILRDAYNEEYGVETTTHALNNLFGFFETDGIFVDNPFDYLREHPEVMATKVEVLSGLSESREGVTKQANNLGYFAFNSFLRNVEIVPPKSNKGAAIEEYLNEFTDIEKTYGFGDALNDVTMFNAVDISIAMYNAMPEIKEMCDVVTEGELGDYVFEYILD